MNFPFRKNLPKIDEEQMKERTKEVSKLKVTASERFTMIWTAFVCIFLPCVGILLLMVFLALLMFGLL